MHKAFFIIGLLAILSMTASAGAQPAPPQVGYVYPAGGQRGTEFEVVLGGQRLDGVNAALVSGNGVSAKIVEHVKPLSAAQALTLRDQLKELQERRAAARGARPNTPTTKPATTSPAGRRAATSSRPATSPATTVRPVLLPAPPPATQTMPAATASHPATASRPSTQAAVRPTWSAADEEKLAEIRKKLAAYAGRSMNPAIAETVTVQVTLSQDATAGPRDLRLVTPNGVTNPLVFCVGQFPESMEKFPRSSDAQDETPASLPTVLNGRIMPGDVDRFRFTAAKGQRIVAAASARALRPYLADAVPGWFQAVLTLYEARAGAGAVGRQLACVDDFRQNPDPVLCFVIPKDGEYVLEIKDAIYRGREDFVYRVALGELPFVTSVFPLGGKAGTALELAGWNLATTRLDAPDMPPGIHPLPVPAAHNALLLESGTLPEALEQEPNGATPQPVTLGTVLNGRIERPGDVDSFRFDGRGGADVVIEVAARRLGSPLDAIIRLTDASGRQIALNDDHDDKADGLNTHHADSYLVARLPADGTYIATVQDVQHKGGREYAYRLRISTPQPDFALRIVPSSLTLRAGLSTPVTVHALRRDGFAGPIGLRLRGPEGFSLGGGRIPVGQDSLRITIAAPVKAPGEAVRLHLEGEGTIAGKVVTRAAVPAEDMQQAFSYRHLVASQEFVAMVTGRGGPRAVPRIATPLPLKIPAGGTCKVTLSLPPRTGDVHVELADPPEGITIATAAGGEVILRADAAKARPGLAGNLLLNVFAVRTTAGVDGKPPVTRRNLLGVLPAAPFDVVAGQGGDRPKPALP